MAPPSTRRSGHSRRAQYTNFFGYVLAFGGALVGVVFLLFSRVDSGTGAGLRGAAGDVAAPAATAGAAARSGSQSFFDVVAGYFTKGSDVARLKREVDLARVRLAEADAVREENGRLKAVMGLAEGEPRAVAVTRLIGSSGGSTRRFGTIGAGSGQGVGVGMPVRAPLGLVGRVLEVGSHSARILLVTDQQSVVPVRRARDGIPAFATGRGDGTIQLRLISLGINPLHVGDAFVTSGAGGLYHPDIGFAVVVRLLPDGAIARPLADPGTTEFVTVEPIWEAATRGNELPPPPADGK
ncbi:rod shape-determining protein MreC [Parablastomonas sp. CN1-191]|uniref:rod shape-determining protein MreC n=1 Tax=Parablastomonas sp. CN1-191 TaxID=3400908 RepID=UPI003BF7A008